MNKSNLMRRCRRLKGLVEECMVFVADEEALVKLAELKAELDDFEIEIEENESTDLALLYFKIMKAILSFWKIIKLLEGDKHEININEIFDIINEIGSMFNF